MERYSLIVVTDVTKPIRRFDVAQAHARARRARPRACSRCCSRSDWSTTCACAWTTPSSCACASRRRSSARASRRSTRRFPTSSRSSRRLAEFERKVRTIANLPGQAATGGEDVEQVGGGRGGGDLGAAPEGAGGPDDEELVPEPAVGSAVPRARAAEPPAASSRAEAATA